MGNRRQAREQALQILYEVDIRAPYDHDQATEIFWKMEPADPEVVDFARSIVSGVCSNIERIDQMISDASTNWKIQRMSFVDRNIIRLAVFEFLEKTDIPPMVSVNEAIELGKRFGTTDSGAFINGILDRIARNLNLTGGKDS